MVTTKQKCIPETEEKNQKNSKLPNASNHKRKRNNLQKNQKTVNKILVGNTYPNNNYLDYTWIQFPQ